MLARTFVKEQSRALQINGTVFGRSLPNQARKPTSGYNVAEHHAFITVALGTTDLNIFGITVSGQIQDVAAARRVTVDAGQVTLTC